MSYNSGFFYIYDIVESNDVAYSTFLKLRNSNKFWFDELSVSDRLRSQLESNNVDITLKIRIPQYRGLGSMCVLKLGEEYYKVYNAYHGLDKEGNKISDLTLTNWDGDINIEE